MKPELVSKDRLESFAAEAYAKHQDDPFSRKSCEIIAVDCARAALKELGISAVQELHQGVAAVIHLKDVQAGAVLVRAKPGAEEGK